MSARWYGEEISFRIALEAGARRRYGRHLTVDFAGDYVERVGHAKVPGPLVYRVDGIDVRGRVASTPVEVRFYPVLPSNVAHLIPPQDYPSIFADPELTSPHRFADRSLCLYFPGDPPELRWSATMGLESLLGATAEHLYFEEYWRQNKHVWLGDEAPHGFGT